MAKLADLGLYSWRVEVSGFSEYQHKDLRSSHILGLSEMNRRISAEVAAPSAALVSVSWYLEVMCKMFVVWNYSQASFRSSSLNTRPAPFTTVSAIRSSTMERIEKSLSTRNKANTTLLLLISNTVVIWVYSYIHIWRGCQNDIISPNPYVFRYYATVMFHLRRVKPAFLGAHPKRKSSKGK
jgi:hypothetical protein